MSISLNGKRKHILERIAHRAMRERGFLPDFSAAALNELKEIQLSRGRQESSEKDLRHLLWASIDNDDSLDLDQRTVAESLPNGAVKILVAIADVDNLVKRYSPIDDYARHNTTSIYTAGRRSRCSRRNFLRTSHL